MNVLQKILVPQESVNDQYVTVVGMPFATGSFVKKDDTVIELETSKAVLTIEAAVDGYIEYLCNLDEEVSINKLIIQITDSPVVAASNNKIVPPINSAVADKHEHLPISPRPFNGDHETVFSTKADDLISLNNINKSQFSHLDFVTEDVVLDFLHPNRLKASTQPVQQNLVAKPARILSNPDDVSLKKIKPGKKREIEYLSAVHGANLVSTIYMDIELGSFFESVNPQLNYFKDSLLPVVIYEVSRLLIKYPILNSYFYDGSIAQYKAINIGVAMDIDDGLKVVKIPGTNTKNLTEIENLLFDLSNKYLDKLLQTENLTNTTFTITDLSSHGAYFFAPLVNKDNAAILGIAKTDDRLNRVLLSMSFDHRVTEGKIATIFLRELKERLESYCLIDNKIADFDKMVCYKCMKHLKDDLNGSGFLKVVSPRGEDKLICESCLFRY